MGTGASSTTAPVTGSTRGSHPCFLSSCRPTLSSGSGSVAMAPGSNALFLPFGFSKSRSDPFFTAFATRLASSASSPSACALLSSSRWVRPSLTGQSPPPPAGAFSGEGLFLAAVDESPPRSSPRSSSTSKPSPPSAPDRSIAETFKPPLESAPSAPSAPLEAARPSMLIRSTDPPLPPPPPPPLWDEPTGGVAAPAAPAILASSSAALNAPAGAGDDPAPEPPDPTPPEPAPLLAPPPPSIARRSSLVGAPAPAASVPGGPGLDVGPGDRLAPSRMPRRSAPPPPPPTSALVAAPADGDERPLATSGDLGGFPVVVPVDR